MIEAVLAVDGALPPVGGGGHGTPLGEHRRCLPTPALTSPADTAKDRWQDQLTQSLVGFTRTTLPTGPS